MKNEKRKGEAKGSLINIEARRLFFDYIDNESDLLIYPSIIDLQIQKKFRSLNLPELMHTYGIELINKIKDKEIKNSTELQAKRYRNLSNQQIVKVIVLINCIIETIQHAILFRSHDHLRSSWNKIEIWIDRSSQKNETREEKVFFESIQWFIPNYTKKNPLTLLHEIHDKNHPFVKNYDTSKGIDGKKLLSNLYFEDSTRHWGVRFTDIIANTLYKAINDLNNTRGMLPFYKKIMKHNHLGTGSNLGFMLFSIGSGKRIKAPKYSILQRMLSNER